MCSCWRATKSTRSIMPRCSKSTSRPTPTSRCRASRCRSRRRRSTTTQSLAVAGGSSGSAHARCATPRRTRGRAHADGRLCVRRRVLVRAAAGMASPLDAARHRARPRAGVDTGGARVRISTGARRGIGATSARSIAIGARTWSSWTIRRRACRGTGLAGVHAPHAAPSPTGFAPTRGSKPRLLSPGCTIAGGVRRSGCGSLGSASPRRHGQRLRGVRVPISATVSCSIASSGSTRSPASLHAFRSVPASAPSRASMYLRMA